MKVFVTGATGFIGRHLVRRLAAEGHQVRCLVRKSSNVEPLRDFDVQFIYGEVNDRHALLAGMTGCDWLFHLANLYSMWEADKDRFRQVNIDGTRTVMECALDAHVQKVVYVSTVAVYGKPAVSPFDEAAQPGPTLFSEYARTKAAGERIVWDLHRERGLPVVVLYPGIVLGEGDDKASGQYIQDILRRRVPGTIFHNSYSTYVSVRDLVDAMVRAAALPGATGQKYLIGKTVLSGKAFVELVRDVSGVPLPLIVFPDWMVMAVAYLLTGIAALIRRPPLWGLSIDAARTLMHGFQCDGLKAERELGLRYSSIRLAMEEAVNSYMQKWNRRAAGIQEVNR